MHGGWIWQESAGDHVKNSTSRMRVEVWLQWVDKWRESVHELAAERLYPGTGVDEFRDRAMK